MTELAVFLINLDDRPSRLRAAEAALAVQDTTFVRVPGVDGRQTPPEDVPDYDRAVTLRYFGRALKSGELGAFQSHLRALETFVKSGAAYGLILEDDMDPDARAMRFSHGILAWQKGRWQDDWHVANLGAKRQKITSDLAMLEIDGVEVTLRRAHSFPMQATALLWTRAGAKAFLKQHHQIDCPWEHTMRRWLTATNMGLAVSPPLFLTTGAASPVEWEEAEGGQEGLSRTYRLRRMRRDLGDRLRAMRHKRRHRPDEP